jgi:hypothetical protein
MGCGLRITLFIALFSRYYPYSATSRPATTEALDFASGLQVSQHALHHVPAYAWIIHRNVQISCTCILFPSASCATILLRRAADGFE